MSDPDRFELRVSLPHDVRFAETIRGLAAYAAQYVGCPDARADAFARAVEEAVRGHLSDPTATRDLPIVVRRTSGPLEIQIDTRTMTLEV